MLNLNLCLRKVNMMRYLAKPRRTLFKGQYVCFNSVTSIQRGIYLGIDWRIEGAVTPVQVQISGTCTVYAAVAAVEGIYHIQTKKLVKFSEFEAILIVYPTTKMVGIQFQEYLSMPNIMVFCQMGDRKQGYQSGILDSR
ncbi:zingipain-1 [Cucumis melo var. makuwa]|uniref:Zingipain-1 n=1 Tax=Cucumis melo var. makuwa TaxID=1194695 RepID=A0A5D3CH88_CUCMM|nr:zingipain-1 [Cucumis melo var. makuwa]